MNNLIELTKIFSFELETLKGDYDNVVIGGSCALEAHGIIMPWKPSDLDVIVFMPTDNQEMYVERFAEACTDYPEENEHVRSYVIFKLGFQLNIIMARDEPTPDNLLSYKHFLINSVKDIIKAKANYTRPGKSGKFIRAKDVFHLQELKAQNFNFDIPKI